jgi:hypothetical protein
MFLVYTINRFALYEFAVLMAGGPDLMQNFIELREPRCLP